MKKNKSSIYASKKSHVTELDQPRCTAFKMLLWLTEMPNLSSKCLVIIPSWTNCVPSCIRIRNVYNMAAFVSFARSIL